MASGMLTGDRKWGQTRKSGMTVLGKVPKPINLPSQRLENHGLDPNVEIVPKGTLTWGSRSTVTASNAWGAPSVSSPNTDGSVGSPSYHSNSYTRPSTATSDKSYHTVSGAWGPHSRPSSSSGILPDQPPAVATRPRSAETGHGGPHRMYGGESAPEASAWGPSRTHEKMMGGVKPNSFNLSSGDFPTLNAEKASKSSVIAHEGDSHLRPSSASGRVNMEKEEPIVDRPSHGSENIQTYKNDGLPQNSEHWRRDQPHIQAYPYQFESWPGAHMAPAPEAMWYQGPPPGGMFRPGGPAGYPLDPYAFYPQVPSRPMNGVPYQMMPHVLNHNWATQMSLPKSTVDSADIHVEAVSDGHQLTGREVDHDDRPRIRVLLKQHDRWKVNDSEQALQKLSLPADKTSDQIDDQKTSPSKRNSPLIEKIEGLNNKARAIEGANEKPTRDDSVESNASISHLQRKSKFHGKNGEEWRNRSHVISSASSSMVDDVGIQDGSERKNVCEVKVVDKPSAVLGADPNDVEAQHVRMREMAKQRAKQLQKEEEERTREQKARAMAKLEELNRRSNQALSQPAKVNTSSLEDPSISTRNVIPEAQDTKQVNASNPREPASQLKQKHDVSEVGKSQQHDVIHMLLKTQKADDVASEEAPKERFEKHVRQQNHNVVHREPVDSKQHKQKFQRHALEFDDVIPEAKAKSGQQKQKFHGHVLEHHDDIHEEHARLNRQKQKFQKRIQEFVDVIPEAEANLGQQKQKFQKRIQEFVDVIPEAEANVGQQKQKFGKHVQEHHVVISEAVTNAGTQQQQKFYKHSGEHHDVVPEAVTKPSQQKQKYYKRVQGDHEVIPEALLSFSQQKQKFQKQVPEFDDDAPQEPSNSGKQKQKFQKHSRELDDVMPEVQADSIKQKQKFQKHPQKFGDVIPQEPGNSGPQKQKFQKHVQDRHDVIPQEHSNLGQQKQKLKKHAEEIDDVIPQEPTFSGQQKQNLQKHSQGHHDVIPEKPANSGKQKQKFQKHVQKHHDVVPEKHHDVIPPLIKAPKIRDSVSDEASVSGQRKHDVIPGSVLVGSIVISSEHLMTADSGRTGRDRSKNDDSARKEVGPEQEAVSRPNKPVEEEPAKPITQWKHQNQRKVAAVWAPVKTEQTGAKSKRAEMERYVPKPMVQESYQQMSSPKAVNGSTEKSTVQSTEDLKAAEPHRPSKNEGKTHSSWPNRKVNGQPKSQWQLKSTPQVNALEVKDTDSLEARVSKRQTEKRENCAGEESLGPRQGQHSGNGRYRERAHQGQ